MDNLPIILANAHLLVIVIICLTNKPYKIGLIKQEITAGSRKLNAMWTIETELDEPHEPL